MKSNYIAPGSKFIKRQKSFAKFMVFFMLFFSFIGISATAALESKENEAEAWDPVHWMACMFGDDSLPRMIYQITQTSDLQFELFSKSYSGKGGDDVRSGLNSILDYIKTAGDPESPYSFEAVNENIIGQNFAGTLPTDNTAWERWNQGPEVSPYDRFGVSGLNFSSYQGEWKHLFIDACNDVERETSNGLLTKFEDSLVDTGIMTNILKVASWNVCSIRNNCPTPSGVNNFLGIDIKDIVWGPDTDAGWENRAKLAHRTGAERKGEMTIIGPDVLLLQETSKDKTVAHICGSKLTGALPETSPQNICFNSTKFESIDNEIFPRSKGQVNFANTSAGGSGGYAWAILEDTSFRRALFISVQTDETNNALKNAQMNVIFNDLLGTSPFAESYYPITIGGSFGNAFDPLSGCDNLGEIPAANNGVATVLCEKGYKPTNYFATVPIDTYKTTKMGHSPWTSHGRDYAQANEHHDHIWVNQYVGIGESRIYAPSGKATSDHAMVSATINPWSTSVSQVGDPRDPMTNKYYDTRLEPRSTWEDIQSSIDPRTQQFTKGFGDRFMGAVQVNSSNFLFSATKLVVVITIAFIGLAFSDVSRLLGITDIVAGTQGQPGLFQNLHEGVFQPLIILAILGTAIYIFWMGIVKRQFREALGSLLRTIICFVVAVMIAVSPAWFISLPNNVAIVAQSFIAAQLNEGLVGGNSLCSTNIAESTTILEGTTGEGSSNVDEARGLLEKASVNMQSSVGCMLWYNFLVRPWTNAQFGSEYSELYGTAGGTCESTAVGVDPQYICLGSDKDQGQNRNSAWVGNPTVPLGGGLEGRTEHNWALFQISTQTNAHAPILNPEDRGVASRYSQGVAHDWWRIVDAISNYDEKMVTDDPCFGESADVCNPAWQDNGGTETAPYPVPVEPDVMEEWNTWTGNDPTHRLLTVMTAFFIAIFGVIAPLFFSLLAAIYAIGIAILMAIAPIFFLFGCWAGRGWELFKSWGDMVINLTMKRIALGLLTIISVVFTSIILDKMNEVGYWKSLMLIVVISIAFIKGRHKVLNAVSFARYSNMDLSSTASRIVNTAKTAGSTTAGTTGLAAIGGITSVRNGGTFKAGAMTGLKGELENLSYRNKMLRQAMDTHRVLSGDLDAELEGKFCPICDQPYFEGEPIVRVVELGVIHQWCVPSNLEQKAEDLGLVGAGKKNDNPERSVYTEEGGRLTTARNSLAKDMAAKTLKNKHKDHFYGNISALARAVNEDIREHKYRTGGKFSRAAQPPPLPKEIAPYIDRRGLELAWKKKDYAWIQLAYTHGWIAWAKNEIETNELVDEKGEPIEINEENATRILQEVQSGRV